MASLVDHLPALRVALVAASVGAHAQPMQRYMRDQFPFLGVKTPARRAASRATLDAARTATAAELVELADACWAQPERELQYVGVDLLRRWEAALGEEQIHDLQRLIVTKPWWDTVDSLASGVVGPMVRRHPGLVAVMDAWIDSPDPWLARTAILHQLHHGAHTDAQRLFRYAERRAGDEAFFIRKALGWALRQHARHDPDAVRSFVAAHAARLSSLTQREALKHAGPAPRA